MLGHYHVHAVACYLYVDESESINKVSIILDVCAIQMQTLVFMKWQENKIIRRIVVVEHDI